MITSNEVYNICNTSNQLDSSTDVYFSDAIPYFNGLNAYDIANAKGCDVERADEDYNTTDEVDLLKDMQLQIPKKMATIKSEKPNKFEQILEYFAGLLERVRHSITKFILEIDNKWHWKNTGDEPPKEPRFYKQNQESFFDDDVVLSKDITKKQKAQMNKQGRINKSVNNTISQYEADMLQRVLIRLKSTI